MGDDQRPTEGDSRLRVSREPLQQATDVHTCSFAHQHTASTPHHSGLASTPLAASTTETSGVQDRMSGTSIDYVNSNYFPPGLQLPSQPLRQLLPILLLDEQRYDGCEQFA